MTHALPTTHTDAILPKKWTWTGFAFCLAMLFSFISHGAMATESFKGGYVTYTDLGGGRYDIITIGYWQKDKVGFASLKYEGWPKLESTNQTLSKTLLADGQTIQHIQKQTISWSAPGLYRIYWGKCCWGDVVNYPNSVQGLLFNIKYDPENVSSSPRFLDLPFFNFTAAHPISYLLGIADPDGHAQEFSLIAPNFGTTGIYEQMLASGFRINSNGTMQWDNPIPGRWLATVKVAEKINGVLTGAFTSWEIILNISGNATEQAPQFGKIEPKAVKAGQQLTFQVAAADAAGREVVLTASGPTFEKGAAFIQNSSGSSVNGTYTWTVPQDAAGTYYVQFLAASSQNPSLISQTRVSIQVVTCSAFPTAFTVEAQPCAGSNSGKLSLSTPDTGVGPYQYSLNNGETFQDSPHFENLVPDTYTALIRDAAGCISTPASVLLKEAPLPAVNLSLPAAICADAAALALESGSPAGGIYMGAGVENGFFYPQQAGAGTHTIHYTFTSSHGCSNTATATITVNAALAASAGPDAVVYASAGNGNGGGSGYGGGNGNNKGKGAENGAGHARRCASLTATATGGSAPYTYLWSNGETSQSISVCPQETTTYLLTITDALGCTAASQAQVVVEDPQSASPTGNSSLKVEISAYPNPLTEQSQLTVRLPEADHITVELTDLSGNLVKRLYGGPIAAQQTMSFDLKGKPGNQKIYIARISSTRGVYHCRLMFK